jgi:hypothetical protein
LAIESDLGFALLDVATQRRVLLDRQEALLNLTVIHRGATSSNDPDQHQHAQGHDKAA